MLLLGALATGGEPSAPSPTRLYVHTVPPGAKVTLEGKLLGKSDAIFSVAPGTHTVLVELEGYLPEERRLDIAAEEITRLDLRLKKRSKAAPGRLKKADPEASASEDAAFEEVLKLLEKAEQHRKEGNLIGAKVTLQKAVDMTTELTGSRHTEACSEIERTRNAIAGRPPRRGEIGFGAPSRGGIAGGRSRGASNAESAESTSEDAVYEDVLKLVEKSQQQVKEGKRIEARLTLKKARDMTHKLHESYYSDCSKYELLHEIARGYVALKDYVTALNAAREIRYTHRCCEALFDVVMGAARAGEVEWATRSLAQLEREGFKLTKLSPEKVEELRKLLKQANGNSGARTTGVEPTRDEQEGRSALRAFNLTFVRDVVATSSAKKYSVRIEGLPDSIFRERILPDGRKVVIGQLPGSFDAKWVSGDLFSNYTDPALEPGTLNVAFDPSLDPSQAGIDLAFKTRGAITWNGHRMSANNADEHLVFVKVLKWHAESAPWRLSGVANGFDIPGLTKVQETGSIQSTMPGKLTFDMDTRKAKGNDVRITNILRGKQKYALHFLPDCVIELGNDPLGGKVSIDNLLRFRQGDKYQFTARGYVGKERKAESAAESAFDALEPMKTLDVFYIQRTR